LGDSFRVKKPLRKDRATEFIPTNVGRRTHKPLRIPVADFSLTFRVKKDQTVTLPKNKGNSHIQQMINFIVF